MTKSRVPIATETPRAQRQGAAGSRRVLGIASGALRWDLEGGDRSL